MLVTMSRVRKSFIEFTWSASHLISDRVLERTEYRDGWLSCLEIWNTRLTVTLSGGRWIPNIAQNVRTNLLISIRVPKFTCAIRTAKQLPGPLLFYTHAALDGASYKWLSRGTLLDSLLFQPLHHRGNPTLAIAKDAN